MQQSTAPVPPDIAITPAIIPLPSPRSPVIRPLAFFPRLEQRFSWKGVYPTP
jgi:hypothetical protein